MSSNESSLSTATLKSATFERLLAMKTGATLPHSFLFIGAPGWGKRALAEAFVKLVLCETGRFPKDCICAACGKVTSGAHTDLKWFGEDEAKNSIGISEIRSLLDWMSFKSFEGKGKVAVLPAAERLTGEAANAMLKLLEEPPAASYLILLTSQLSQILDTIRSRCILIRLKPFSRTAVAGALKKEGASEAEAAYWAMKSEGSLAKALLSYQNGDGEKCRALLDEIGEGKLRSLVVEWSKLKRKEVIENIRLWQDFLRDALVFAATGSDKGLYHQQAITRVKSASREGVRPLRRKLECLVETERALQANVNQKLALTRLGAWLES